MVIRKRNVNNPPPPLTSIVAVKEHSEATKVAHHSEAGGTELQQTDGAIDEGGQNAVGTISTTSTSCGIGATRVVRINHTGAGHRTDRGNAQRGGPALHAHRAPRLTQALLGSTKKKEKNRSYKAFWKNALSTYTFSISDHQRMRQNWCC